MVETKRVITTNPYGPASQGEAKPEAGSSPPTTTPSQSSEAPGQATAATSGSPTEAQPTPEVQPEGHQFTNPRLAGRSPAEVEGLYGLAEQTVRQQGQQISDLTKRMNQVEATPAKTEEKISSNEFFADPGAAIETLLEKQIAPLRAEVAEGVKIATAPAARDGLRREFPDWDQVEPYVDHLLQQQDFPDPTHPGLLKTLYYTAKGLMVSQGIDVSHANLTPNTPQNVVPGQAPPGMAPPQHRASTPPAPPRTPGETTPARQLTELEKRLAREWKMSDEEYLYWQDLDERDVPTSTYGLPEEQQAGGGNR